MIQYGRQNISDADILAVVSVLESDFLTQGPVLSKFENAVASLCKANYSIAVNSATSALHVACVALGLKSGDWLWTTPITFVASANCGIYCGARVDFVDINPLTYNISIERLEEKLIRAEKLGLLPKVVVAVHFSGQPCEMLAIQALSQKYGFKVIEDASHAVGSMYRGKLVGNCEYSDITVFSFHPVKIITTGEGGMALTNNAGLAEKMSLLRSHGITRDPQRMTVVPDGPWYYEQTNLGFNYRMSDIHAALGLSQISRLSEFISLRINLANYYDQKLSNLPLVLPWQHPDGVSSRHLYVVRVPNIKSNEAKYSRSEIIQKLNQDGIGATVHYIPVHLQPFYRDMGFKLGQFPEAERYYDEAITLPLYPALKASQQDKVVEGLSRIMQT